MLSRIKRSSGFPLPLVALLLTLLLPTASAAAAAENVNLVGFWLGFTLLVLVSAIECIMSMIWTRVRVFSTDNQNWKLTCHVCAREIINRRLEPAEAGEFLQSGSSSACGFSKSYMRRDHNGTELVVNSYGNLALIPTLLIRRFDPSTSLSAPAGLVDNVEQLFKPSEERKAWHILEHTVHLLFGLLDISLAVAGLAYNPNSPKRLYEVIKDPKAPMSFNAYSTLFLLYWFLGAVLLPGILSLRSSKSRHYWFALPTLVPFVIASLGGLVLFCLGCWKLDYARRHDLPWTPLLSYWIAGASTVSIPCCGVDVVDVFGVVGLVFMLIHAFS